MNKLTALIMTAGLTAMATACVDRGAYSSFTTVEPQGWAYGDTLRFEVARADSLKPGTLTVAVRNTNLYPYSNLWLEVSYNHDGRPYRDTVNMRLADAYGRWTGKGFGAEYQTEATVAQGVVPANGSTITLRHIMRADTLRGLEHVGVTLKP
ncbi:MAG: gliding motility lipoprotein GldH [Bacteroides sp.]|nr:gliding motility lipoprotein GldH [Bacteroides sp.]